MNPGSKYVRALATLVVAAAMMQGALRAGSADDIVGVEKYGEVAIRDFALKVNDVLDAKKVNLAIVARSGRSRSELPRGISYTHVAFAVFEPVRAEDGAIFHTYTIYNLYQGGKGQEDRSYLKQDVMYDLVAGVFERDVAICVPNEILQERILRVIRSSTYQALHTPEYNLVANPWVDRFDNCVTHTLKVCVAAIYQTDDRTRIYDNIRAYFKPTPVRLGPIQAFGSNFVRGMSREDRDPSGLQTASYDSLHAFLAVNGLLDEAFTVTMD